MCMLFIDIRKTFDLFDKDKNGTLSREEIAKVLRNTGCNPTAQELEEMFKSIDTAGMIWLHIYNLICIIFPIISQTWRRVQNRIGGVMVSVLASNVVDHGFKPRSGQTNHFKIGICCFSAKNTASKIKSNDLLARNQNNVPEWSEMFTHGLLFQWSSTIKFQLNVLV